MSTSSEIVRAGRAWEASARPCPMPGTQRPSFRWSDIWKAPLHDFPIRDEILYQYLLLSPDMEVLEVGPGSGFTAFRLARRVRRLALLDVAPEAVEELRVVFQDFPNVACIRADVSRPGMGGQLGQSFDAAFGLDMFEYVPDPAACLRNLAGALRCGGELLLTYPNVPPPAGDGVTYFSRPAELEELLRQAGFRGWQVFSVRLKPWAAAIYRVLHEWPLQLYRRLRSSSRKARPQTYEATWAFQNRAQLLRYKVVLHLLWAALLPALRLGGDVFMMEPLTEEILGRQMVIRAWK